MVQPEEHEQSESRAGLIGALTTARAELVAAICAGALLLVGWVVGGPLRDDVGRTAVVFADTFVWLSLAIGMFYGGRAAIGSLKKREFDIDVLMVLGAGLAAIMNQPAEGALLLFLFTLAGALEDLAMQRTTKAVEALHGLMPTSALRLDAKAGEWAEVEPESLAPGDRIKILPGETIPTDSRMIESGLESSAVNQATLTGESMPRVVRPGDELYAGTVNVGDAIEADVLRPMGESSLQRILNLVIEAQQQREPVQRAIDRLSQPYAIGVTAASIVVLVVWWLILGQPLWADEGGALYTAITLLIVMSPCAVIISTPTATLTAITRGAREGVLFKGGQAIERLSRIGAVAFDKTGTLTIGRPRVVSIETVGDSTPSELLAVASGLEQESTHPIAAAIREAAADRGVESATAHRIKFTPGRGVGGEFEGLPAHLGTFEHAGELAEAKHREEIQSILQRVQSHGQIGIVMAWNGNAGVFVLEDEPRPGAEQLVERLNRLGVDPVLMLTGDNTRTAEAIATRLGIHQWRAEMLPEQKVEEVKKIKRSLDIGAGVGVIGDGVNDAPALAAADVSLAIGSIGSDAALESADIVLLAEDLRIVPWAVRFAKRARWTVRLNLIFALAAIGVMAVITLVGSLTGHPFPLWMGVIGHEGGTLLVVANSLLLLLVAGVPDVMPARTEASGGAAASSGAPLAASAVE